ncbi:MAG: GNAT family N-acetyltransferase [Devosia sp.]|uniref:GNAT family N-acetyltransferase n=1 Tax=Devosia sp. TaxID=1871048 RepID=UPI0024C96705|nr:GNAT family N-acetyltransferase [Devosia sp.]UYN98613.1 MAG: GNAT family N-acetyltransferase [Devosia sp.]
MTSIKHYLPATLRTERLVLSTPTMADAPAIAALCNNKNVHKWMARLPFPYTAEDARFFIEHIVPSDTEACYGLRRGDDFIGVVGLTFSPGAVPELGYWLGEPYWGHGYATEAAQALVAAARAAGAGALGSRALLDNAGSRKVLAKTGFVETGTAIETANNLAGRTMVLFRQELDPR